MKTFITYQLAVTFYHQAQSLKLPRHLSDQLARAASSSVLNLAEGRGKPTIKDQLRFFHIAFGSVRECQAVLDLAQLKSTQAWSTLDALAAHLYRLIRNAGPVK